jgi:hypothetical protein
MTDVFHSHVYDAHLNEITRLKQAGVLGQPSDLFLPDADGHKTLVGAERSLHDEETKFIFEGTFDDIAADVINILSARIALDNRLKGFWPDGTGSNDDLKLALYPNTLGRNPGEMIALAHSEQSESLEAIRSSVDGGFEVMDDKLPHRSGYATEQADTIIRALDMTGGFDLKPGTIIVEKLARNRQRPYKHGRSF